jgi:hypothetical protein
MADKTNLDNQNLKGALDQFEVVRLRPRKHWLRQTATKGRNLVHLAMSFIAPMLILLVLMMCGSRRGRGNNFESQFIADNGRLGQLDRFCC